MNREIKFRAWCKSEQVMHNFAGVLDGKIILYNGSSGEHFEPDDQDDYEVMQFTGLFDSEGIEICEGDVMDFVVFDAWSSEAHYRGIVKFAQGEWQLWKSLNEEYYGDDGAFSLFGVMLHDSAEVIGNIYEHPHLVAEVK